MTTLHKPLAARTAAHVAFYGSETATDDHQPHTGPVRALFLGWENNHDNLEQVRKNIASDSRFDLAHSAAFDLGVDGELTSRFLNRFDAVLFTTNAFNPDTARAVSDLLHGFVDQGGGVVITTFFGQEIASPVFSNIQDGINSHGYNPLVNGDTQAYMSAQLGEVFDRESPIMNGVNSLGAQVYRGDYFPGLDDGAQLIANWSDGKPLVAINAAGNVADVTLFPVYDAHTEERITGDYVQLFANALSAVSGN